MSGDGVDESVIEEAVLAWFHSLGWDLAHGPDAAPGLPGAERASYAEVILEQRVRDALANLNPELPAESLDDAFRKVSRPEGPTLESQHRRFSSKSHESSPFSFIEPAWRFTSPDPLNITRVFFYCSPRRREMNSAALPRMASYLSGVISGNGS